ALGLGYDTTGGPVGVGGVEGPSSRSRFGLAEARPRAGRTDPSRLAEARLLFEQMLGYGNHLGLYSEQIGPSGEALGNFPQALTHLSLITSAIDLDQKLSASRRGGGLSKPAGLQAHLRVK